MYIYEILFRLEKRFLAIFNWVSSAWYRSWIRLTRRSPPSSFPCAHVLGPSSHVRLFAAPWIVARQAPLSVRFSQQECWSALPSSPPGNLPNPGVEPVSWSCISYIAGRFFAAEPPGSPPHPSAAAKLLRSYYYAEKLPNRLRIIETHWKSPLGSPTLTELAGQIPRVSCLVRASERVWCKCRTPSQFTKEMGTWSPGLSTKGQLMNCMPAAYEVAVRRG